MEKILQRILFIFFIPVFIFFSICILLFCPFFIVFILFSSIFVFVIMGFKNFIEFLRFWIYEVWRDAIYGIINNTKNIWRD
jgi:hypothetical protein